jgi:Flp pilus assembly protein TadB
MPFRTTGRLSFRTSGLFQKNGSSKRTTLSDIRKKKQDQWGLSHKNANAVLLIVVVVVAIVVVIVGVAIVVLVVVVDLGMAIKATSIAAKPAPRRIRANRDRMQQTGEHWQQI